VTAPQQPSQSDQDNVKTDIINTPANTSETFTETQIHTIEPSAPVAETYSSNEDALLEAIQLSHLRHKILSQVIPFNNSQCAAFEQFTNQYLRNLHESLSTTSIPPTILNQIIQSEHIRFRNFQDTLFDPKSTIAALDDEIQKKKRSAEVISFPYRKTNFTRLNVELLNFRQ
jgi:hypothetical protein